MKETQSNKTELFYQAIIRRLISERINRRRSVDAPEGKVQSILAG